VTPTEQKKFFSSYSTAKGLISGYTKNSKNQTAKEQIIQLISGQTN
jgi:hypothetical protein